VAKIPGGIDIEALAGKVIKRFARDARVQAIRAVVQAQGTIPVLTEEREISVRALRPDLKRFHGAKVALSYFPQSQVNSACADKYGYMAPAPVRTATKLPFNVAMQTLLGQLGTFMGNAPPVQSLMPAGFTYFGQFVDHDITFDVSSSLTPPETDATTINNMRSPSLDLDSLYGRGPALSAFLYAFPPASDPASAIRFQLGSNRAAGPGGPAGTTGMVVQTAFDVPRVVNPLNPALSTNTAIIGDPRNDENLIVSQFHRAMLRFHNKVVDDLVLIGFAGDIFAEAKRVVTHHYQWAVVNDYLKRICGAPAVASALAIPVAPNSPFSMPVEFAVAAYRFGHSQIRHQYWLSGAQTNATLGQVFDFVRNPNLPVLSNWVVDFNAFFQTGIPVPVFNNALKIDSALASGLSTLPGMTGMMAVLATGLAFGLPSGQGMAGHFGIMPMSPAQLTSGLAPGEVALLNSNGGILLQKTPLWYYCLREAAVIGGGTPPTKGEQLGPVGARIVAETFIRMLKRDPTSYLNTSPAFVPGLASAVPGDFTVADLINYAGVNMP